MTHKDHDFKYLKYVNGEKESLGFYVITTFQSSLLENLFHEVMSIIKTVISTVQLLDTVFGMETRIYIPALLLTRIRIPAHLLLVCSYRLHSDHTVFPTRMGHILQYSSINSRITNGMLSNGEAVNVRCTFTEDFLLQFLSLIRTTHLDVWSDIFFA